ncbi:MAG TPA: D-glycero-beta-D-manno-heptose 1-phosphate adenylyltransferase [Candidatus Kapabacteria bacterium]|nr:D-glycero-beta-D-manno-heptose 1-phosphate adenylyltransferase [Candidatus Kapabacteria bacterium]
MLITSAPIFFFRDSNDREALAEWRKTVDESNWELVFTNGVFDLVHAGHVAYLLEARNHGDALLIGLNSDASVRAIKGPQRPIQEEHDRATVLAALKSTDAIVVFEEETPFEVINFVLPDTLVKGGDYTRETIVGGDVVEQHGGRVLTIPFIEGRSTSGIVERIIDRYGIRAKMKDER